MRISILNASKTPASARNRANKLRLRLRSERLLPHPPEQFQSEIALKLLVYFVLRASAHAAAEQFLHGIVLAMDVAQQQAKSTARFGAVLFATPLFA
ncbi:hypothetical protein [Desulfovibrio sp. MES5]|uniref:hypothetical protein n=1 Tax=Desulfovibrio sp. MES5 TaxID=1899016 RepID=UPI0025BB7D74|nr:hypothetical protein [Desulfovibrio sp. MES5]